MSRSSGAAARATSPCHAERRTGLQAFEGTVPIGQRLVAVAPLTGDWVPPRSPLASFLANIFAFIVTFISTQNSLWPGLVVAAVLAICLTSWRLWWRQRHPRPAGMAGLLSGKNADGPVLLVTDYAVLATTMRQSSGIGSRAEPIGPGHPLPGLVAIEAAGERLILSFADGSRACLKQRTATSGAAARVAALAGPILERQRDNNARAD